MRLRGAIVGIDPFNPVASINIFQYNPHTLTRTITPQINGTGSRGDALRLAGPPKESLRLEIDIDATDRLETGEATAVVTGIHSQLAALEMLVYPKTLSIITNSVLMAGGMLEIVPPEMPLTLFIWGPARVVPVKITSLTVTETAYDHLLNPILATVAVSLDVLNTSNFAVTHPGFALAMVHQVTKEALAVVGSVGNVATALGG
jgi:hypothetical protein